MATSNKLWGAFGALVLGILVICVIVSAPPKEEGASTRAMPMVEVIPSQRDLGTMLQDERRLVAFEFVNHDEKAVFLEGIRTTCGCASVERFQATRVGPGDRARIEVEFDSRQGDGPARSSVFFLFRRVSKGLVAPPSLCARGQIVATVQPDFRVKPNVLDFGQVNQHSSATKTIVIEKVAAKAATLHSIKLAPSEQLDARIVDRSDTSESISVEVVCSANVRRTTYLRGAVQLEFEGSRISEVSIPVFARFVPEFEIIPARIVLGRDEKNTSVDVSIRSRTPFSLGCVEQYDGVGVVMLKEGEATYKLQYRIDASKVRGKTLETKLLVVRGDGTQRELVVPIVFLAWEDRDEECDS